MRIVQHTYVTFLDMDRLIHFGRIAMTVLYRATRYSYLHLVQN